jgi:amino-acid N-acetyltransferase
MNTSLATQVPRAEEAQKGRCAEEKDEPLAIRSAGRDDAPALYRLITANLQEGHLLPRTIEELVAHAPRFVVATRGPAVVACGELTPLGGTVAEIRSLVVDRRERGSGVGRQLVEELVRRARAEGFARLCAFTHRPAYFVRLGFSIVPQLWVPEKVCTDCWTCPLFRHCGQNAVVLRLEPAGRRREAPLRRPAIRLGAAV